MENKATIFDLHRMCHFYNGECNECIVSIKHNGCCIGRRFKGDVQKINDTIFEWCKNNPPKTYKQDFLEKFPNAEVVNFLGRPNVCLNIIYGMNTVVCNKDCVSCWNTPMEEDI